MPDAPFFTGNPSWTSNLNQWANPCPQPLYPPTAALERNCGNASSLDGYPWLILPSISFDVADVHIPSDTTNTTLTTFKLSASHGVVKCGASPSVTSGPLASISITATFNALHAMLTAGCWYKPDPYFSDLRGTEVLSMSVTVGALSANDSLPIAINFVNFPPDAGPVVSAAACVRVELA